MAVKQHKELWRTVKFVLFSASAGIIQFTSFELLNWLLGERLWWVSYLTALVLSVLWNFTFNRRFTFKSSSNVPVAMLKVFAYYCVFAPVTTIGGDYLVDTLRWDGTLVTIINMALNLSTEFLYQKYVVYRNSIDTNELAQKENETLERKEG
jgi:putative flippase GtrA